MRYGCGNWRKRARKLRQLVAEQMLDVAGSKTVLPKRW
jgi:hypothetical protein